MSPRRRRRSGGASSGFLAPAIAFGVALLLRIFLAADGLTDAEDVRIAERVSGRSTIGLGPRAPARVGHAAIAAPAHAFARGWLGARTPETALLYVSVLSGALAAALAAVLARELELDVRVAATAGLLVAFTPLHVAGSAGGSGHVLAAALGGSGLLAALVSDRRRSTALAILAALLIGAAGLVRLSALVAASTAAIVALLVTSRGRSRRTFAFAVVSIPLAALPIALDPAGARAAMASAHVGKTGVLDTLVELAASFTPVGILIALAGCGAALAHRRSWPIVVWFGMSLVVTAAWAGRAPALIVHALVPAAVLTAGVIAPLVIRWRWVAALSVAVLGVVPFVTSWNALAHRRDRVAPKAIAQLVRDKTPGNALVLAGPSAPYVRLYGERDARAVSRRELPALLETERRPLYVLRDALLGPDGEFMEGELRARFDLLPIADLEGESLPLHPRRTTRLREVLYRADPR